MSETIKDSSSHQEIDPIRSEAERLLDEIKQFRVQAEEQFKAAETSRKNADSEGLFAINAKRVCEEHSTEISQLKGTVEVEVKSITVNKQASDEVLAAVNAGKATIDADTKTINDRRKEVDQASQEIVKAAQTGASRLQEIENSKAATEKAVVATNEALKATTQARANAKASQEEAAQFSIDAKTQGASVAENLKATNQRAIDVQKCLTDAQTNSTELGKILEHVAKSDTISVGYEAELVKLKEELALLIKKADDLLPGFTSAGLATAFGKQKDRFAVPQKSWLKTFIACIILLVVVALPSFLMAVLPGYFGVSNWSETLHGMVMRLPILLPLIWLAIYAGRNYMLLIRLEEDYAYKEAISIAFEGYKREMQGIAAGDATNSAPINKLCVNILSAIAERPGRIYDHHNKDFTLANEMLDALAKGKEFGQKQTRVQ